MKLRIAFICTLLCSTFVLNSCGHKGRLKTPEQAKIAEEKKKQKMNKKGDAALPAPSDRSETPKGVTH